MPSELVRLNDEMIAAGEAFAAFVRAHESMRGQRLSDADAREWQRLLDQARVASEAFAVKSRETFAQ